MGNRSWLRAGAAEVDISEGTGACVSMASGVEANVRNFRMIGGSGFAERDQCGSIGVRGESSEHETTHGRRAHRNTFLC